MDSRNRSGQCRPNTKALLVDHEGRTVYRASASLEILQPQPGFVEQNPLALLQSVVEVAVACLRPLCPRSERASHRRIALTNQREAAVIQWRRAARGAAVAGEPIGNAITWQCRRSAGICDRVRAHAAKIQSLSGLPLDPLISASKWAWLFEQKPRLRALADTGDLHLGTVDSWLLYRNLTVAGRCLLRPITPTLRALH